MDVYCYYYYNFVFIKSANLSNNIIKNSIIVLFTNISSVFWWSRYYEINDLILISVNLFKTTSSPICVMKYDFINISNITSLTSTYFN